MAGRTETPRAARAVAAGEGHGPVAVPGPGVEWALGILRASGARVTTPRRLLVAALFAGPDHRSAEELAAAVQQVAPEVSLSTIYRNLEELERLGLVVHAHLGHGPAVFHLAPVSHGHLVCTECGAVVEAPEDLFRGLAEATVERFGFVVDAHHFAVPGRCARCRGDGGGRPRSAPPRSR